MCMFVFCSRENVWALVDNLDVFQEQRLILVLSTVVCKNLRFPNYLHLQVD